MVLHLSDFHNVPPDSLRLLCGHRGHIEETKSVEFAFVAICLRLAHHNDCTMYYKIAELFSLIMYGNGHQNY